jgi:hypothetical protein
MSAAYYYAATHGESIAILRDLCEQGFRVIPDRTLDAPVAVEYPQVTTQLEELLREGPGFYLAGEFTKFPIQVRRHERGPATGRYTVDALTQGPLLEGLLARDNVVDGALTILLGYISHQAQYKNPDTGQMGLASAELKAAYKRAATTIKKHLVKHKSAKYLIGPEALRLVEAGKARVQQHFAGG